MYTHESPQVDPHVKLLLPRWHDSLVPKCAALVNILDSSDKVTVENDQFEVNIEDGMPKVYFPQN